MRRWAWLLSLALVLIPVELDDLIDEPKNDAPPLVVAPLKPSDPVPAITRAKPPLQPWSDPTFDRASFLASFRRQSELGLRDCLIAEKLTERSFSAAATLHRNGTLTQLRWNNEEPLPSCVRETIQAMGFSAQANALSRPKIELQWRVDW